MTTALNAPTTEFQKLDRASDLDHRPRVLLGKMGLDGHDRGVKVIARALRDSGVHVIYSGLWQTPRSLAISARDEDVDVIAASMMSNSHLVLGPRLVNDLREQGRGDIPVYMGGILPSEDIEPLKQLGIAKCFTTATGLLDIVNAVREATRPMSPTLAEPGSTASATSAAVAQLARDISMVHGGRAVRAGATRRRPSRVVGVTGSPGAGKSTIVAQLAGEFSRRARASTNGLNPAARVAVVAFDPMSPITSGALLGDRLRVDFNTLGDAVFYRSLAISGEDYHALDDILQLIGGCKVAGTSQPLFDTVFVETVGAGQNETRIRKHVDKTLVVMTPGMGDSVQMDKAGILEIADVFVCNKADHPGQNELVRNLRDSVGGGTASKPIVETVATMGTGVGELLDLVMG